jgi:hypothetical protein
MVVLVLAAACNNDDSPSPRIDRVAPPQAKIGEVIDILGEKFCALAEEPPPPPPDAGGQPGDAGPIDAGVVGDAGTGPRGGDNPCAAGFVTFGPIEGLTFEDAEEWTDTRITIRVPQIGPGPTSIVVTVNGRQSEAADFEVIQ